MGARIFAIADTLDAMMSDRPYRRGRPYSVARAEIERESGRQFDPQVVAVFLSIPEETWVKIRTEGTQSRTELRQRMASAPTLNGGDAGMGGSADVTAQAG